MKITNRILALFLSLLLVTTMVAPLTAQAASKLDLPIVYVKGASREIYNKSGKKIFPTASITTKIKQNSSKILSAYNKGVLRNDWSYLQKAIEDAINPIYKDLRLNTAGEISNGSYSKPSSTPKKKKSGYTMLEYSFEYDSRLDPLATAAKLNSYINSVLKATGKKKVQLIGRCLGGSIISAYLVKYGSSKIDTAVFYATAGNGLLPLSAIFSGKVEIDYTALYNYTRTNMDSEYADIIQALTAVMSIIPIGKASLNAQFKRIAKEILPDLVLFTRGTMPAYWSMVGDEYYEAAKKFTFGKQTTKYAKLIDKIDNYHYNVQRKLPSKLKELQKKGLKLAIISKYNVSLPPLFEYGGQQADGYVELAKQSFGAITCDVGKSLSVNYLDYIASTGKSRYISKDQAIDASTCLFPDYSWFLKDCTHSKWASSVHNFIMEIFHSKKQYTINTNSKYPQFLKYNDSKNKLTPITSAQLSIGRNNPSVTSYALATTSYTCNGKSRKPGAIVRDNNGNALKSGTHYTITYDKDCSSIGVHKATIKMKGYFSGSKTLKYKIVPAKVTGLKASPAKNSITLSWNKAPGVSSYVVYSYNASTKKYAKLKTVNTNKLKITGLKSLTAYSYAVMATKKVGDTTYNGAKSSVLYTGTAPSVPKLTATANASKKQITLKWNKVSSSGYAIYMSTSKNGTYKRIKTIKGSSTTSYTKTGLTPGKAYYFKIKAYKSYSKANIYCASSQIASAVIKPNAPTPKVTAGKGQATVKWNKTTCTGYAVYMATSKNGDYKKIATVKGSSKVSYIKKNLTKGKTYYFKVRAYTTANSKNYYSSYSSAKSAKIK